MRAILLDDSSQSYAQLLAGGYDVVVCSYEFFEANGREFRLYHERITEKANGRRKEYPKRPRTCLHTDMMAELGLEWKIAVLDEAQRVNKRGKTRHESLKLALKAQGVVALTGTLAHNRWHDISGYLAFGTNHPFDTHNKFLHAFSSFQTANKIDVPALPEIRKLQRFLQAFTIIRPASILNLKDCIRSSVQFNLHPPEKSNVSDLTEKYKLVASIDSDEMDAPNSENIMGLAVRAIMASLHPMLAEAVEKGHLKFADLSEGAHKQGYDAVENLAGSERDSWLDQVQKRKGIVKESGRLTAILRLYRWLRSKYPTEKMIIFSSSLRFLDIVAEGLAREYEINALRFDGLVPPHKRVLVERTFRKCDPEIPLLLTISSGKFI